MRRIHFFVALLAVKCLWAWNSIDEMESDVCIALSNSNYLVSEMFTGNLNSTTNSASIEMKTEAYIILSISAYQKFLDTADDGWLCYEMQNASNAVASIGIHTSKWQYWMAKFTCASAQVSMSHFSDSYLTLTNALAEISTIGYTNDNPVVERAILSRYEMPDLGIAGAMKVFAGMTAAQLGMGNVATNYANQLSGQYRNKILEFIR